jgi:hypothetical protein
MERTLLEAAQDEPGHFVGECCLVRGACNLSCSKVLIGKLTGLSFEFCASKRYA